MPGLEDKSRERDPFGEVTKNFEAIDKAISLAVRDKEKTPEEISRMFEMLNGGLKKIEERITQSEF